ncbi:MAG: hypothetical protein KF814_00290 [Nitrospiraceae bacterium]|nr:hypothetical protein [Nitrospiraceae bacterium]
MTQGSGGGMNRNSSNGLSGIRPLVRPAAGLIAKPVETGPSPRRSIEVHIEELVLHGFSQADRRPIADAVERELSSLFLREGLPADRSFEIERMNGGTFRVDEKDREGSTGKGAARAIYGGLSR